MPLPTPLPMLPDPVPGSEVTSGPAAPTSEQLPAPSPEALEASAAATVPGEIVPEQLEDAQPLDTQLVVADADRSATLFAYLRETTSAEVIVHVRATSDGSAPVQLADLRLALVMPDGTRIGGPALPTIALATAKSWEGDVSFPIAGAAADASAGVSEGAPAEPAGAPAAGGASDGGGETGVGAAPSAAPTAPSAPGSTTGDLAPGQAVLAAQLGESAAVYTTI